MGPDFTVQYTDITMLETSQTADFKALANSLLELVTRLEIVMKAIFSKENFMAMEPISMQTVTNLWVDLDLAKKLDVEFFESLSTLGDKIASVDPKNVDDEADAKKIAAKRPAITTRRLPGHTG